MMLFICVFFTGVPRKYSPKNRVNIYLVKMYKCGNDVTLTKHFVDPSSCPNRNRDYSNFVCSKPFDNINACASLYKKQLPKLKMHQRLNVKILWMHFDLQILCSMLGNNIVLHGENIRRWGHSLFEASTLKKILCNVYTVHIQQMAFSNF